MSCSGKSASRPARSSLGRTRHRFHSGERKTRSFCDLRSIARSVIPLACPAGKRLASAPLASNRSSDWRRGFSPARPTERLHALEFLTYPTPYLERPQRLRTCTRVWRLHATSTRASPPSNDVLSDGAPIHSRTCLATRIQPLHRRESAPLGFRVPSSADLDLASDPVPPYPDDPYFNPFHEFFGTTPLPYFPEHQYYGHNPPLARTPFPSMPTSFVDVPPNFGGPAHPNEMLPRHNSLPPSYTGRPPRHLEPQGTSITTSSRDASQVVARRTRSRSPHSKASTRCGHDNFEVYRVRDRD